MSLLTAYYHKSPEGVSRRIPLCPFPDLARLKWLLSRIRSILSAAPQSLSYAALWQTDGDFRDTVGECLALNGMSGFGLGLGDMIALCVGQEKDAPLLATYNLLTDALAPVPKADSPVAEQSEALPPIPKRKFSQVFPLFNCRGELVYPRGVTAANHGEFEAVFFALTDEAQDLQMQLFSPHPGALLFWSEELGAYCLRLIELFGLDPTALNIHQVCELAFVFEDGPGLLPQLAGLVDTPEPSSKGYELPETDSLIHFIVGAMGQSGVHDWEAILQGLTYSELKSFQQGLAWRPGAAREETPLDRQAGRDDVFMRLFGEGGTGVPSEMSQMRSGLRG